MTVVTRKEAKDANLKFYYTGKPCKHGHLAERYTSNNICIECQSTSNRRYWSSNKEELVEQHRERLSNHGDRYNANRRDKYETNVHFREQVKQRAKDWYYENREDILVDPERKRQRKEYQQKNREQIRLFASEWRSNNRQRVNEQSRLYQSRHRTYYNARQAAYRAQKMMATPTWCEHDAIAAVYERARQLSRETEVPHHVDHVVPLVHPLVCGLHCLANLQILTERDNKTKTNKFVVG